MMTMMIRIHGIYGVTVASFCV